MEGDGCKTVGSKISSVLSFFTVRRSPSAGWAAAARAGETVLQSAVLISAAVSNVEKPV